MPIKYGATVITDVKYNNTELGKVIYNGTVVHCALPQFEYKNIGGFGWAFSNSKSYTADEDCLLVVSYGVYNGGVVNITCNGAQLCNYNYNASGRYVYTRIYKMVKGNTITVSGSGSGADGGQSSFIMTKIKNFGMPFKLANQGGATQAQSKSFTATRKCLLIATRVGYDYSATITQNGTQKHAASTTDANRWASVNIYYMTRGNTLSFTPGGTTGITYPHNMLQLTEIYF